MIATVLTSVCRVVAGATVEWRCDATATTQRIYFANHSSHLDFIVIWSALPHVRRRHVRPVAGRDYWERTTLRRYVASEVFRAVLVDRRSSGAAEAEAGARASIEHLAREMGGEDSLIVFPEGTRSATATIGRFKSGLYHLSRARPDAEVVPVHLGNLHRILPKGERLPVPMVSRVVFGPALPRGGGVDEEKDVFLARARLALLTLGATV